MTIPTVLMRGSSSALHRRVESLRFKWIGYAGRPQKNLLCVATAFGVECRSQPRHGEPLNTVLVVAAEESLRARLVRSLSGFSVFEAQADKDALRTLRLVDIDIVLRAKSGPSGALSGFLTSAREIAPHAIVIAVGGATEEEAGADFAVNDGFTSRELEAVLHHALDRQRLTRELASRSTPPQVPPISIMAEEHDWDGAALARVLRGFTGVLAAGFDIPRALGMFVDAIGEVVRPTRVALLIPDSLGRDFRIASSRGLAPQLVQGIRLPADEGLMRWLAVQGRPAAVAEIVDAEILRELKLLQAVVAVPLLS